MMQMLFVFIAAIALAACKTTEQAAYEQYQADSVMCARYGFTYGTEPFGQCMLALKQQREQAQAAAWANAYQGLMLMQQSQPQPPINCTATTMGAFTNMTCQ
jgi:hypothetical protein